MSQSAFFAETDEFAVHTACIAIKNHLSNCAKHLQPDSPLRDGVTQIKDLMEQDRADELAKADTAFTTIHTAILQGTGGTYTPPPTPLTAKIATVLKAIVGIRSNDYKDLPIKASGMMESTLSYEAQSKCLSLKSAINQCKNQIDPTKNLVSGIQSRLGTLSADARIEAEDAIAIATYVYEVIHSEGF